MLAPSPTRNSTAISAGKLPANSARQYASPASAVPPASTSGVPMRSLSMPGRDLEARHRAGEHAAQRADRRIAQAELRLPDRQHHDDEIGVAVVQRMRAARGTHRAPLFAARAFRGRAIGGGAHAAPGRRSTKPEPMNESTGSPFWFVPVLRANTMPQPGRVLVTRFSTTSEV